MFHARMWQLQICKAILTVFKSPSLFQNVQPSDSIVSFHLRPPLPTSQNDYTNWEMAAPGGREENYRETNRDQPSWENGGAHPQIPMPLKKLPQTPMDKVIALEKPCSTDLLTYFRR